VNPIKIVVLGTPASFGTKTTQWKQKDSATGEMTTHRGQSKTTKAKQWEQSIRDAASNVMDSGRHSMLEGEVRVWIYCMFPMKGPPRKKTPRPKEWKDTSPDLDKIERLILDGLQGTVFHNDSQVVSIFSHKCRAAQGEPVGTVILVDRPPHVDDILWPNLTLANR
jgi:Holliday junction resolvase RusA-like endonuclease